MSTVIGTSFQLPLVGWLAADMETGWSVVENKLVRFAKKFNGVEKVSTCNNAFHLQKWKMYSYI